MARIYAQLAVFTELPTTVGWNYGGYPYGLEPLVMPFPACGDASEEDSGDLPLVQAFWRAADLVVSPATDRGVAQAETATQLDWFRWITGHQISFLAWRMAAQVLAKVNDGRRPPAGCIPELSAYVELYSAMLLYTGSCTSQRYQAHIRPSMQLHHPSFSGSWAPDFVPIRHLLRGRLEPFDSVVGSQRLQTAVERNTAVHEYVAARLVPNGLSLLRGSPHTGVGQDLRLLNQLYDNYFLTIRAPASRSRLAAQLLRRVVAVVHDLQANGVTDAGDLASMPEDIRECAMSIPAALLATARYAVGRPAFVGLQLARRSAALAKPSAASS